MIRIEENKIDVNELMGLLEQEGAGSVVIHIGVCKSDPQAGKSEGVSFQRAGDAEAEMQAIEEKLRADFKIIDVILAKRVGKIEVGSPILFAAVSSKDRENSFGACQAAVSACKKMKSLKKTEHLVE